MRYIICEEPGTFQMGEAEMPTRSSNQALVKIHRIGICGTDLHAFAGNQAFFTYPRILGHELAAEVMEIDENDQGIRPGDRVGIMPYVHCGTCIACRSGKTNCCQNIQVLGVHTDGGMQEYITVPNELLLPAQDLEWDQISVIEPLAIGTHAIRRAAIQPGETILVMGAGPIGLGIMKFAQILGARVLALDINPDRLAYAKQYMGAAEVIDARENPVERIAELTGGDMATVVFDATGHPQALMSGPDYMAHGGRFVLVGLSKGELTYSHPAIHAKETTLMCSRNATKEDFERVMEVLRSGEFPVDAFVTHHAPFEEMIGVFDQWLDPKTQVIKAVVHMG
ncbi:zinc-binding alcohol dehydrogenase family protein [Pontibacter sp. G13]|uniref:zinc-binding alcohol dehydrogenase family protein n=1 Tax=Pontibacter sp. G13 TaxID=3074898 RepID=UPI002889064A|nr:zinc-binding alcohol dehydrogenase family protein [Pontibacter sp. G13]WNJ20069.1 zinc-binding alcohol dehydrogenase family protein [Pontibacter sp. G13]